MQLINPFTQPGKFYKANLHTHTTNSDGLFSVNDRARQYKEHGYSILAITDHHVVSDIKGLADENFLVISAMEMHPPCPPDFEVYHLVCLNVPFGLKLPEDSDANTWVRYIKEAGGELIFAHPYWCGHNVSHMNNIEQFIAVEVFNTTCTHIGKGFSSVHWDDNLDQGRIIGGVAVDDCHSDIDMFKGWTMIKAADLTINSVMDALRCGSYYCSCGPVIENFEVVDGIATLKCSPVSEVHFMGRRASGGSTYTNDGETITQASIPVGPANGYIRAEVVDEKGKRAWTNPIMLADY